MLRRLVCPITCLLALGLQVGCAQLKEEQGAAPAMAEHTWPTGRAARELALQQAWVGRTRGELLRSFGTPQQVLEVPGHRVPRVLILVYRPREGAGGCIDAFVVQRDGAEEVGNYFCR